MGTSEELRCEAETFYWDFLIQSERDLRRYITKVAYSLNIDDPPDQDIYHECGIALIGGVRRGWRPSDPGQFCRSVAWKRLIDHRRLDNHPVVRNATETTLIAVVHLLVGLGQESERNWRALADNQAFTEALTDFVERLPPRYARLILACKSRVSVLASRERYEVVADELRRRGDANMNAKEAKLRFRRLARLMSEELRSRLGDVDFMFCFLQDDYRRRHGSRFQVGSEGMDLLADGRETAQDPARLAMRSESRAVLDTSIATLPHDQRVVVELLRGELDRYWPKTDKGPRTAGSLGRLKLAPGIWTKVRDELRQRTGEWKSIDALKKAWQRACNTLSAALEARGFSPSRRSTRAA